MTLLVAVLATSAARAQEPPAAEPELQAAKATFEEAQSLYLQGAYDDAAARFLGAYEKKPFAAFLFNAAVAYEKAGKIEQAVEFFRKYLEREPDASDAAAVKARIEGLVASQPPAAPATPDAPAPPAPPPAPVLPAIATKGLVIIDSKPPGAAIYLDDKKKGAFARTPWQGSLEPRATKLIVEAKGFKPEERKIEPRTDKVYELYIALSEEHFLGWIEVTANVPGADVFIDRRESGAIGRTPYTGHVKPGKHTVWVQKPGYSVARKDIEVRPGTATTHVLALEQVSNGWITVVGKQSRGGTLKVDGKVACTTPCQHTVAPGKHEVAVTLDGMEPYEGEVQVTRSSETLVDVRFSPKPSRGRAWTLAVMTAVFVGAGAYVGTEADKRESELRKESARTEALLNTGDPRVTRGKYYAIGANVLFGLGALTGLMSAWNFLISGPDSTAELDERRIGWAPVLVPRGGGLAATGTF